ncbi:MAG: hypothetical protein HYV63_01450 [Candidatus Schekmanbacteria bacterium]|nr:hypothetical protein [Candidatus Schekmanbacteria bacterium]
MTSPAQIYATIGPASLSDTGIDSLVAAGVSGFRLNLSHLTLEQCEHAIGVLASRTELPVILDTEGPQIRCGAVANGGVVLRGKQSVTLRDGHGAGDESRLALIPHGVTARLVVGDLLKVDFDLATLEITETHADWARAAVVQPGRIGSNKGVTLARELSLPILTEKDRNAVALARDLGVRWFALSFVRSAADVAVARELLPAGATVIAKIENRPALAALPEILAAADAVLIDRGDLSKEHGALALPFLQRHVIRHAVRMGVPAFVSTDVLGTMAARRYPSVAELNDFVATLVMGASGVFFAAETAIGVDPALVVSVARRLIRLHERWRDGGEVDELVAAFCDEARDGG